MSEPSVPMQAMVAMRNKSLPPARRKEIAEKAVQPRWGGKAEG